MRGPRLTGTTTSHSASAPEGHAKLPATREFSDQCWLEPARTCRSSPTIEPFNDGFLTTAAQKGAGWSAGLIANREAAMELMGAWDPGVIASLTPDEKPLPDLLGSPSPR